MRASEWVLGFTLAPLLQWGSDKVGGRVKVGGAGLGVGFSILVGTITIIYVVGVVIRVGEGEVEYGDGGSSVLS